MAKLYFRYGAMGCGKSALLLQVAYNYEERGMKVVLLKPGADKKGDDYLVSRIGLKRKVDYTVPEEAKIEEILKDRLLQLDCILVDEAQFLSTEQVDDLMKIVIKYNIPVICYGLRADFQTKAFPGSIRLFELAHSLEEIKTICQCGKKAMFNSRKVKGKTVFEGSQVAIDGFDEVTYEALCPKCYFEKKEQYEKGQKSVKQ